MKYTFPLDPPQTDRDVLAGHLARAVVWGVRHLRECGSFEPSRTYEASYTEPRMGFTYCAFMRDPMSAAANCVVCKVRIPVEAMALYRHARDCGAAAPVAPPHHTVIDFPPRPFGACAPTPPPPSPQAA